ncbi:glycosyltransferase [Phytohabitans sp. LJ34]|uniref:glycosyltransferase n=1 Tax=Phytohabitans sp. LJ34 TaxID=3452217 RepID=UPI003F89BF99
MAGDHERSVPGLDGQERQAIAAALWDSWRSGLRRGAIITGLPGIGKSTGIVSPLIERARKQGLSCVLVDAQPRGEDSPIDAEAALLDDLRSEMEQAEMEFGAQRGLFTELRVLLRRDVLVVIDEFQRLLDPAGRPVSPFADELGKLVSRAPAGALWLLSNREIDPRWTGQFHVAKLPAPPTTDAINIVLANLDSDVDPDDWFPVDQRERTVERLGANPRILRLLARLLGKNALDQLLGPDPGIAPDPALINAIEIDLVRKAAEGLSEPALSALNDLSVLDKWADDGLRTAMIGRLGDTGRIVRELVDRYLLETRPVRQGSASAQILVRVHPVVRELNTVRRHGDETAWRAAHRRAGEWYARPLLTRDLGQVSETRLATALDDAERHLDKAQADEFGDDISARVRLYLARYEWVRDLPEQAVDRDGRIALLGAYLTDVDAPPLSYHLSHLLWARGGPDDRRRALTYAKRATVGQAEPYPWLHWIQLVRQLDGFAAAAAASREALPHVMTRKARIYVELGAALAHDGRVAEAVAELRKGCQGLSDERPRLAQHALFYATGETDPALLRETRDWLHTRRELQPQALLADVLLLQHQSRWAESIERAREARAVRPLVHLSMCEAIGCLAVGEPARARMALADARKEDKSRRRMPVEGKDWLAAMIELMAGRPREARRELARYLDDPPAKPDEIRDSLLSLWDRRIATQGEFNPSLHFPILPPSITGLPSNVHRPQYGGPVLPQHRHAEETRMGESSAAPEQGPVVLAVATEWRSVHGGLSTFNRQLCTALAQAGARVFCTAPKASETERQEAADANVTLVRPLKMHGGSVSDILSRRPELPPGAEPDIIIGHGRVTGRAAENLRDHFPDARRVHFIHMAPDEIEWLKTDRKDDTAVRAEERTREEWNLGRDAHRVVAVGPRLYDRYVRDFSALGVTSVSRMDPGFDVADVAVARTPPPGGPWSILLFGRAEDAILKGLDIAARAVALAAADRGPRAEKLELKVRGAPDNTSAELVEKLVAWANNPLARRPIVRSYSTDHEDLGIDLRAASLVLVPSRAEGFGLVGVEAIQAGTPALISEESGLGKLLEETLDEEARARVVVPVTGNLETDATAWSKAIAGVLRDREAAFADAARLRTRLAQAHTWSAAAIQLLDECRKP